MNEPSQPRTLRLIASAQARRDSMLKPVRWPPLPDPPIEALIEGWRRRAPEVHRVTVSGGEPTTRADLPELIAALAADGAPGLGLATDGLALVRAAAIQPLVDAGLVRACLALHCGASDAHDWLVGLPGAAARVRRAVRACRSVGLRVTIEATVTRCTAPLLPESVVVFAALGAHEIHLQPLCLGPANHAHAVTLAPRLGQLPVLLEAAVRRGERLGVPVRLQGFPSCAAPGAPDAIEHEIRGGPGGADWAPVVARPARGGPGLACCSGCPPSCPGIAAEYVEVFGWAELNARGSSGEPPPPVVSPGASVPPPGPRRRWRPAVDARIARARARDGGPPPRPAPGPSVDVLEVEVTPDATSRLVRQRLVWASAERPGLLRLVGLAQHPRALALLAEIRLLHTAAELVGGAGTLAGRPDGALAVLAHLQRVIVPLEPPPEATEASGGLEPRAWVAARAWALRLESLGIEVELSGRIDGIGAAGRFLRAWERGLLPGTPRLHLATTGTWAELVALARVDHPAVRSLLPACLGGSGLSRWARLDERGRTVGARCPCGSPSCPGPRPRWGA